MLKLLHPVGEPTREELEEYMAYALEGRRRVKEQLNKRKADDEYEAINLSFINLDGNQVVVWCPESRNAAATQNPVRRKLPGTPDFKPDTTTPSVEPKSTAKQEKEPDQEPITLPPAAEQKKELTEQHYKIFYGESGYTYERIFGDYLRNAKKVFVTDPYIRATHQIANFIRFCELVVKIGAAKEITLETGFDDEMQKTDASVKLDSLKESLKDHEIKFNYSFNPNIHDRVVKIDNGWIIKIGRGFDIYQKPDDWFSIGANDLELRPCLETMVDIYRFGLGSDHGNYQKQ